MGKGNGQNIIYSLQRKWTAQHLLSSFIFCVGAGILIGAIAINLLQLPWLIVGIGIAIIVAAILFFSKKIQAGDVVKFINVSLPHAEESAFLILKPTEELNFFEKLQHDKIKTLIEANAATPAKIKKRLRYSLLFLLLAITTSIIVYVFPVNFSNTISTDKQLSKTIKPAINLPEIDKVSVLILPPAYTRKSARKQDSFNISAEEGATITWSITTTIAVNELSFLMNDQSIIKAQPIDATKTKWSIKRLVSKPGFYQVKLLGKISELYSIEMIKDQPPVIAVQSPKPQTLIEPGMQRSALLSVLIKDDYAINSAAIFATIASGSGEAVSFREQQLSFPSFNAGAKQSQLERLLDLTSFGMKSGDELYFYVSATDSKGQVKRTDMHSVRIEDTAQLMSIEGMASGVDIQPEFFRSQRQIIIETLQLLRDKPNITAEQFKLKSTDLGVDQKLLRLRYGKFLGEETDTEIGEGEHHEEDEHAGEEGNDIQKIMDQYTHKHDIAEDATFFDAKTKKQLKATLTEMWNAELQLRIVAPKKALPFEYKALKLLKDLQQQTRAYVAKTGLKTTPLKPEKRLTGELKEINQTQTRSTSNITDPSAVIRKALGLLEALKSRKAVEPLTIQILEDASMQLSNKAAQNPSGYIDALSSMRKILNNNYTEIDINKAGRGLQKMLLPSSTLPVQSLGKPRNKLSQQYFKNLNKRNG